MKPGPALSGRVIREFHGLCNHAYDAWVTHRTLFDDNPRVGDLDEDGMSPFFSRLFSITQEYSLHQIAKLHDPAVQQGRTNLTLEFVLRFGAWDQATAAELGRIKQDLDSFAVHVRDLRNRSLSHNDLEAILSGQPLGAFPDNADKEYFKSLQQFVDVAHDKTMGGPFPFHVMAQGDVFMFLKRLLGEEL